MYQIQPTQITTQNGECEITLKLEINVNINSNGEVSVAAVGKPISPPKPPKIEEVEDKIDWAIPDFNNEKIQFGKKVEE